MGVDAYTSKNEKEKLNICFVSPDISVCGGVQRVMAVIANGLARTHHVTIISINNEKEHSFYSLDKDIAIINFKYYCDKKKVISRFIRGMSKKFHIVLPEKIAEYAYYPKDIVHDFLHLLQKGKYDCIIGLTAQCTIFLGLVADGLKSEKIIGWHHNSFHIYFQTPFKGFYVQRRLAENVLKKLDTLITLTQHDAQQYWKWMRINSGYIYNPLSFCSEKKADMSKKILLYVGRIEREQKGIDLMLQIAEKLFLYRGMTDWKLRIVGNGSWFSEAVQQSQQKGLEKYVEFFGEKEDVKEYYIDASIFLSTSRWEGFGLVITEAMECGLPVVSFMTDGPSEIIQDKINGYLIENYDLESFTNAVEQLMNDKDMRVKMSQRAIERARDFYPDRIIEEWEMLIK